MGLDMFLRKKTYIGGNYEHNKITGSIDLYRDGKKINIDLSKVVEIEEEGIYWRKANAIHAWFVDNVQDGEDECNEYYVSYEKLKELRDLCLKVIKEKKPELLAPRSGFFFGSTEPDEYYYNELQRTADEIEKLNEGDSYYYQSSW